MDCIRIINNNTSVNINNDEIKQLIDACIFPNGLNRTWRVVCEYVKQVNKHEMPFKCPFVFP